MASLWRDHGTSTAAFRAAPPLRMRVNMSAMGSVSMGASPAGLHDAGNLPLQGELAQADAAHAKAAVEGARPPAEPAAVVGPHPELGRAGSFHHQRRLGHVRPSGPERHAEAAQQRLAFGIRPGGRADHHGQSLDLVDLVEVDLGKYHLFANAERVVAATVEGAVGDALEVADAGQRRPGWAAPRRGPGAPPPAAGARLHAVRRPPASAERVRAGAPRHAMWETSLTWRVWTLYAGRGVAPPPWAYEGGDLDENH